MIIELIGPDGLALREGTRVGFYRIPLQADYRFCLYPAGEVYAMFAGEVDRAQGAGSFTTYSSGARVHQAPMVHHATRIHNDAFMSLYVWQQDESLYG